MSSLNMGLYETVIILTVLKIEINNVSGTHGRCDGASGNNKDCGNSINIHVDNKYSGDTDGTTLDHLSKPKLIFDGSSFHVPKNKGDCFRFCDNTNFIQLAAQGLVCANQALK